MRPLATTIALALVLLLAAPAAAAEPATRYLAVGDSLAVGDGASDPATTGYVPRMADYFAGAAHGGAKAAVNLAVGGETTGSFIAGQIKTGARVASMTAASKSSDRPLARRAMRSAVAGASTCRRAGPPPASGSRSCSRR